MVQHQERVNLVALSGWEWSVAKFLEFHHKVQSPEFGGGRAEGDVPCHREASALCGVNGFDDPLNIAFSCLHLCRTVGQVRSELPIMFLPLY